VRDRLAELGPVLKRVPLAGLDLRVFGDQIELKRGDEAGDIRLLCVNAETDPALPFSRNGNRRLPFGSPKHTAPAYTSARTVADNLPLSDT